MSDGVTAERLAEELEPLYRFAVGITRDPDLASDLVQDTFVRAVERADQFRGDAPLRSWLRRILHNLAVDRARRSHHEVLVEEVEEDWQDDAYTVDPAVVVERAATREELEDARTVVLLHDVEGWKVREIAELEHISLPAAKQRLRRGRMMLVSALASGAERRAKLEGVPMRCWDARRHVSEYLDGKLDAETAQMVEAHLAVCPTCPPLYAALVGVRDKLGDLRDPDSVVPPELERRIRGSVAE